MTISEAGKGVVVGDTGTQTYRCGEYADWLASAGFANIRRIDLDPLEKGSLILAVKSA